MRLLCTISLSTWGKIPIRTCPTAFLYNYTKDNHARVFTEHLRNVINNYKTHSLVLDKQKQYADSKSWNNRAIEWQQLFNTMSKE